MAHSPTVAVIILNFNSAAHTLSCVESLLRHTTALDSVSLVVVDNHSAPQDRALLSPLAASNVRLIDSERNLGFAGGMMLGARSVEADYYFFLNNDCELQNDVIAILTDFMQSHQQTALCGTSMLDADGRPRSSFNYFPSLVLNLLGSGLLRWLHSDRYPDRRKRYTQPIAVDVVSGAALFVRGTALKKLGGLDTGYFLYCEEEDFALRVKKAGWQTYWVPQAEIMHIGGASSSQAEMRPALQKEFYISFFRYLRLHHGWLYARVFRVVLGLKLLRRAFSGKAELALVVFVLRGAPEKESLRYRQSA